MGVARNWVLPLASVFLTAAPSTAHAQSPSTGMYSLNQAAGDIGFTIYGSAIFKIKREGRFREFTGELSYDPMQPASSRVDLTVFTASVDMHNAENDQLLKSGGFFDVAHFPTMHFTSSSVEPKGDGTYSMTGDMTIRGITRRLTIPVRLRQARGAGNGANAVFETTFQIDRTEFGLNGVPDWNGFKISISKNVQIRIAIATAINAAPLAR